jgi:dihydroorotate dehydrogenase (fumarate)
VGLANKGAAAVQRQIARWGARKPLRTFPVVVSVAKTNNPQTCSDQEAIADYLGSLQLLQHDPHVAVLELNISCPNTYGGEPFTDPQRLEQLLSAVDALDIAKPIWVKMPINHTWQEFDALLAVVTQHNVQAVTIGNLNKKRDAISSDDLPSQVHGNLSGLPTQALSDSLIEQTYQHYGDKLLIVGVGGVFTAQDAYRKLCLGASLVELITGLIYEGPQLIGQINRELADLFARDGYHTITQAIGSAHAPRKH